MKALASGRVDGEVVLVDDERGAQRLQAKGSVGQPLPGGGLRLSRIEAAHAVHAGRLDVGGATWTDLAAGNEVGYFAYADLRDRGLVVRHDGDAFQVWPRGEPATAVPWFRFHPASERDAVEPETLVAWAREGGVVGLVDDDGAVTHYRLAFDPPVGDVPVPAQPIGQGVLLEDRVVVPGGARASAAWLGTVHGDDLVLSFTEAETLRRRGVLDVPDLTQVGSQRQHHFLRTLPVYEALREAGVVAKSGFRFGTHMRGYAHDPERSHAQWLIQCALPDDVLHWSELSRAVRLAHGVRKTFLLAVTDPVRFAGIAWFRP